jgi:hypothetical protein
MRLGKRDVKTLKLIFHHAYLWYESLSEAWKGVDDKQGRECYAEAEGWNKDCLEWGKKIEPEEYGEKDVKFFLKMTKAAIDERCGYMDAVEGIRGYYRDAEKMKDRFVRFKKKILGALGLQEVDPFAGLESINITEISKRMEEGKLQPWEEEMSLFTKINLSSGPPQMLLTADEMHIVQEKMETMDWSVIGVVSFYCLAAARSGAFEWPNEENP